MLDKEPLRLGEGAQIKEVPVWGIDCYTRRSSVSFCFYSFLFISSRLFSFFSFLFFSFFLVSFLFVVLCCVVLCCVVLCCVVLWCVVLSCVVFYFLCHISNLVSLVMLNRTLTRKWTLFFNFIFFFFSFNFWSVSCFLAVRLFLFMIRKLSFRTYTYWFCRILGPDACVPQPIYLFWFFSFYSLFFIFYFVVFY